MEIGTNNASCYEMPGHVATACKQFKFMQHLNDEWTTYDEIPYDVITVTL